MPRNLWSRIKTLTERVGLLRFIGLAVVGVFLAGWQVERTLAEYATVARVSSVAVSVDSVDRRVVALETHLGWIVRTLDAIALHQQVPHDSPPAGMR